MKQLTIIHKPDNKGWWFTSVKEIKGCHTQGKTLEQARERIKEALELFIDDVSNVDFIDEVRLPKRERELIDSYLKAQVEVEEKQFQLQKLKQEAATSLNQKLKISTRDTGQVMQISHQRVNQLVNANKGKGTSRKKAGKMSQDKGLSSV